MVEVKIDGGGAPEALILGAGFSRAASEKLPLANQLGQMAYERASQRDPTTFRASPVFSVDYPFEVWLSLLAEEQPHLREADNLENAARFAKLKDAIVSVLQEAQDEALTAQAPSWLYDLLSVLRYQHSAVLTLNYDTLIEVGLESLYGGTNPEIDSQDLLRGQPPLMNPNQWRFEPTSRLLKLHGSLDWWWVPDDRTGATLVREPLISRFGHPVPANEEQRSLVVPGREPFIIPPLATKSRFYQNPLTRQLWQDAFKALSRAERIALVGYSLPQTDIVMAGMLEPALRSRDVYVEVVNPEPEDICKRLQALGGPSEASGRLLVTHSVEEFVRRFCLRASEHVIRELSDLTVMERPYLDPVAVGWRRRGEILDRRVVAVEQAADAVTVVTDDVSVFNVSVVEEPSARRVLDAVRNAKSIIARTADGREAPVVGYSASNFGNPDAVHLLRLFPAGQLAEKL